MKAREHLRMLDQRFRFRSLIRELLSSGIRKRYLILILILVILAGLEVKSQSNSTFNGFDLVDKAGNIRKPANYRDLYQALGVFSVADLTAATPKCTTRGHRQARLSTTARMESLQMEPCWSKKFSEVSTLK